MKIFCIDRNYPLHAKEFNISIPEEPIFFIKPDTALLRNNEPFYIPPYSNNIHAEVEVVFRICKVGKNISLRFAHRYYDAVALGINFTAKDILQHCIKNGLPWEKAKAFDNSAVISSLINKTEFNNVNNIFFSMQINGEIVQKAYTSEMLFSIEKIIVYLSQFLTLKTGDLIYTGTPQDVTKINIGDHIEGYIEDKKILDFYIK